MSKSLVIVESPAKARTIANFLGKNFIVESSIGHIRDLPKRAGDVPEKFKKQPWARLGVDVDNGFKPLYVVDPDKRAQIKKLKDLLKRSDALFLATDEDREGESIAWHLLQVLSPKVPVKRMVFHEITERAISEALEQPREVDRRLVDAQEARRILDRLYGYEVSPVLWKKVMPRLSAGRVQSVATRIVVERERERIDFVSATYWDVTGTFEAQTHREPFEATLVALGGKRIATGKDFAADGKLKADGIRHLDQSAAKKLEASLEDRSFTVKSVERKPLKRTPAAPFMTSTLQQEAGRKLRFSAARTMRAAQTLYENGFITYMRTDSTTLSEAALEAARERIATLYGSEYLPKRPRRYAKKVKNAQEAHEAIRPAGEHFRLPDEVKGQLGSDEAKLYELVWKRTVASQMEDARLESVVVRISSGSGEEEAEFSVSGNIIKFPGFLRAYVEGSDDPEAELDSRERPLPPVEEGQSLSGRDFSAKSHETQPPARFTEASLVRRLEELGVGRPSTYASIISTIQDRGYVWKKGSALVPSFRAFAVVQLLEQHFGDLVDYAFTARMEDDLDLIAQGDEAALPWLSRFYFGEKTKRSSQSNGHDLNMGLRALVADQLGSIDARAINSFSLGKDDQDREIVVRVGRYGAYLQRGEDTASIPDELPPDELDIQRAVELLHAPSTDRELGTDPDSGQPVYLRRGRFGAYVQLGEAGGKNKPRTSSLLRSMEFDQVTLDEALRLLSLPRLVGVDPKDDQPITTQLGRYGPYVSKGKESRSLEQEDQVFSLTLEQALHVLSQPRKRPTRGAGQPLKQLGDDPVSGKPITLRQGRFGHYVTDGDTNASLRRGDVPETLTEERAQELLQARRERGPATPRGKKKAKRKAAKKAPTKKAAAKKTPAKKAAAKKTVARKSAKKKARKKAKSPKKA